MRAKTKKNLKTLALVAGLLIVGLFVWAKVKGQKSGQTGWEIIPMFNAKRG